MILAIIFYFHIQRCNGESEVIKLGRDDNLLLVMCCEFFDVNYKNEESF